MTPTPRDWCTERTQPDPLPSGRDKLVALTPSNLCSYGWRPLMITGLLRDLLINLFSEDLNITQGDLRQFVWRNDDRSGILIESITRWQGSQVEKRPAVLIKRNAMKNVRLGIADRTGVTEQGFSRFQTFWVGSHTLFCIHGSGAGTEILATEVQRFLTQSGPRIGAYLLLRNWQVTEVDTVHLVQGARQNFVIPVTVGWTYSEQWQIMDESTKLKEVSLDVLLDGAVVN